MKTHFNYCGDIFVNLNDKQTFASRCSGKVLLTSITIVFVFVVFSIFITYGMNVATVTKSEAEKARLASFNLSNVQKNKSKVGVVWGVVHNPPNSSAVVDKTIVHVGDKIRDVVVVGIHENTVEFSKDGLSWQQGVQEAPHAAWTKPSKSNPLQVVSKNETN
jgi:hypothetical protein